MLTPLYLGVVLGPLSLAGTINILPTLSKDFEVSLSFAGLAVTVFILALVLVQFSSGVIAEFLGPSRTLVIGLMVFSVSCLMAAVATSYPVFLVVRAVQGFGVGLTTPVSMGIAAEKAPVGKTSTALGGIQAAFTLGLALGPIVGGLFAEHLDWRGFYLLLAIAALIAAVIVLVSY
jgi:MFS family permease